MCIYMIMEKDLEAKRCRVQCQKLGSGLIACDVLIA